MRFSPGASLGPFEIQAPIGAGGMGEVYRARDTRLDRTVALKLLPSELVAGPSRRAERFRSEARAIARITHPNICTLHDVGEDGSSIYLVMEYVEGETLARRLEDGPLPLPLALRTAIAIADALDHAHRHGVVHRDVKPGNIILSRDGVKLLDFGLAKLREPDESPAAAETQSAGLTDVGVIVGTLPYMAPEQIDGSDVDGRTDIFSFGVVLFEMVGGRRPFAGDSRASLLSAVLTADPPALTSLQPQAPEALERLVRRCLAKNPDDRWQTARDVAAELRWIADASAGAAPKARSFSRRPGRAMLLGGGVGAALAAALFAAGAGSNAVTPAVEYQPVTFRKGIVTAARFTPDGRSFVYTGSWEGQPHAAFLGRAESPDARDLQLPDGRILSISPAGDMALVFGPQSIERTFGERTLARIPMAGGARRDLLTGILDADWIPGTDALAVIRDPGGGRPWHVEFPAGTKVHEARAAWSLRVSPDGSRIAFFEGPVLFDSQPGSMVTVVDKSGQKTTVAKGVSGFGLAWPPSGTEVWFTAVDSESRVGPQLTAASLSGVRRAVHRTPDWMVLHDIAADGTVLVSRNTIRIVMTCKPPTDERERDLTWLLGSYVSGISRDGETVVFSALAASPLGKRPLYRRRLDGSPAVQIGEGSGAVLSPDGNWVLTWSDDRLVLLPTGAGTAIPLPRGEVSRVGNASWLGDSKRIVFTGGAANNRPKGYVQEIPAGVPRAFTPGGVALAGRAAARHDGAILGRVGPNWKLFSLDGGEGEPVSGLTPRDTPLQWSPDGRYVYAVTALDLAKGRSPALDVFRVELATGQRTLWKTLSPADPVGVETLPANVVMTPDTRAYCYSSMRRLGDLFVARGLR